MDGNSRVEKYMEPVGGAIDRHIKRDSREGTDIYNRAHEAVRRAVRENQAIIEDLVEALEQAVPVINNLARNIELIPGAIVFSRKDYRQMMGNIKQVLAKAKGEA